MFLCASCVHQGGQSAGTVDSLSLTVTKRYLNLPVSQQVERSEMQFLLNGKTERTFAIRLAANPEYWTFCDISPFMGQTLTIRYSDNAGGLREIYQGDTINGQSGLYRERHRPQFHFTTRRGWNNDPNGLVYYDGEYHLFYQHNPYEREWENMHWGHAVSRDLVHWEELPVALYPDTLGMMFSGSAVVDFDNTSGFGATGQPPMVAAYTAASPAGQVQCIAYSLDKGRTWAKYSGNPVIDSGSEWNTHDTRDPKVFRHAASGQWVMVLNECDGHSIYTSPNLLRWTYRSHVTGFWECPDLFELPVNNNPVDTRWVLYGASASYMIGAFDGNTFTPQQGKYCYTSGALYAAQTLNDTPDGRRIQIGWGRIQQPGMPFNMMMLLPTELTLSTTPNGIRLFSYPVKEVDNLQEEGIQRRLLSVEAANELLKSYPNAGSLRIKTTFQLSHATSAGLKLDGQDIINYDLNFNRLNGNFYSPPEMTSMALTADILIDLTSIEVFIDGGAFSYAMERTPLNTTGFRFWSSHPIEVKNLEIYPMKSIWK
ncbi:MAG: glycoside hydrolase family 32 protein [Tannerellaceae bacterium]|nr:glycoside hydrolase family 32 protein [Tannerellaceae bacterium]